MKRLFIVILLGLMTLKAENLYVQRADDPNRRYVNSTIEKRKYNLMILSKTVFARVDRRTYRREIIDLTGKNFIVISMRERGSEGRLYAVDRDGLVWWTAPISSGAPEFASPSGVFPILLKKRYHMSTLYPSDDGVNNMNYTMRLTHSGVALHEGDTNWLSHGCIHIDPKDVPVIYNWSKVGETKVVMTREGYMPFAKRDLERIYLGKGLE
jgi:lipoprotein-anchoring transpeptidase ErfK/SrfK